MTQIIQNTLYLLTPGLSVHADGLALRIEQEKQLKLSLPTHNIESVFVFHPSIYVSAPSMHLCWERGVSICFFSEWGRLLARVEGVPQGSVLLRLAQCRAAGDLARTSALARQFVAGKIANTRWLIGRTARESDAESDTNVLRNLGDTLAHLLRELEKSPDDTDIIRGLEGRAAALHFSEFTRHLRPALRTKFPLDGRSRRPPRDAINSLLSFLYALLRHDCVSALAGVGLDPFIGFLHAHRSGRESLALDLMEEFRPAAERVALTLLNRTQLQANDFTERDGGAVELSERARKTIVAAWQQRKQEEIRHPLFEMPVRFGQLPLIQARILARVLRGDASDYTPHLFT